MVAALTTAGVSGEVAQEIQMPVRPQMLEDAEEPIIFRVNPGVRCVSNLEDTIHHIGNSRKSMQLYLNFSFIVGTWEMEALLR